MLDGAGGNAARSAAAQRKIVGLGSPARKHDPLRLSVYESRYGFPCILDARPCTPAPGMHRRGIAAACARLGDGRGLLHEIVVGNGGDLRDLPCGGAIAFEELAK